jgi:predicted nucleic acid-binding protein
MMTIPLADTSAWIDALRHGRTVLPSMTERDEPIGFTEPVMMELLSGCRNDRESGALRRLLLRGQLFGFDAAVDFEGAAGIYQHAKRRGFTTNSHVDCMIIAVAVRNALPLITLDRKQAAIAEIFGVTVI